MSCSLILKSLERKGSRQGREILLSFSDAFSAEMPGDWIHLPSLSRVRLKPLKGDSSSQARIKGMAREYLHRGDRFLPMNAPVACSQRFFGYLDSRGRLPSSGELNWNQQRISYRISAAPENGAGIVLLELLRPVDFVPGTAVQTGERHFTPLTVNCYRKISRDTAPFKAQGWLPKACFSGPLGTLKSAESSGEFLFFLPWLDWVRALLRGESRKEGGLETKSLSALLGIPPYLVPDLLDILARKSWFQTRKGIILDAAWDYSGSLSPMSRGILEELRGEGFLVEKIAGSPHCRALELLVRCALAVEIEEGVFMDSDYADTVYRKVVDMRQDDSEIGLSELARRTGLKKRFLIPLLQYGDSGE
ncbi:hypothetical protein [Marispirochaeta sp.]|uniref:hypothetical protein n=1 Tax=Marispirochaeta sp. TaxID=2038653 RepID=UPI0029C81A38|nr:hypothetical protein [Marispirochaeta sp.]